MSGKKKRKLAESEAAKEQEDDLLTQNNTSHNNSSIGRKEHATNQLAKYAATKQREAEQTRDESRLSKSKWQAIHIQLTVTNEENGDLGMANSPLHHNRTRQQIYNKIGSIS